MKNEIPRGELFECSEKLDIPCRTQLFGPTTEEAEEVWVLLHGYGERSNTMVRRFSPLFKLYPEVQFVIPNGFFPIPRSTDDGYKEAYAWYFYEHKTKTNFISPQAGVPLFQRLLKELNVRKQSVRIIGFSQGGFLVPFIARAIDQVVHTIGLSCFHPLDFYPSKVRWQVDAIHGEADSILPLESAKKSYQDLKNRGINGSFYSIPELGHDVNQETLVTLQKLISIHKDSKREHHEKKNHRSNKV